MIDLSLNEAETLATRVARGARFSWGLAEDIGGAARTLAKRGEPWAEALLVLAQLADGLDPPSPERAARWRRGEADLPSAASLCPVRGLVMDAGIDPGGEPLRLARIALPLWLQGMLWVAGAETSYIVGYDAGEALSQTTDVTVSAATTPAEACLARRARIYVPESEGSRVRGAGGGSVDAE